MEKSNLEIERSSDKSFGIVFAIFFILLGSYLSWKGSDFSSLAFIFSIVLLIIAFLIPTILKYPNYIWFKLGMLLGSIIAPIVMALVYITTIIPMGIIIRLTGKDILHIKFNKNSHTYWIQRDSPPQPMKNQF